MQVSKILRDARKSATQHCILSAAEILSVSKTRRLHMLFYNQSAADRQHEFPPSPLHQAQLTMGH